MVADSCRGESSTDGGYLQDGSRETFSSCSTIGQTDSDLASHLPSPIVVLGDPTPEESGPTRVPVIRGIGDIESGSLNETRMVVHQDKPGEREEYIYPGARYDHGDKCIHAGVVSCLQGCLK